MKLTDADNAADGIFFPALEQNMMGAVLINENDEVMFFNPAAEKLWGYKREEVIGNNIDMLIPRDLRPAHPQYIRHNREGGKARVEGMSRELQLEKKDGSKIWTRFALSKVSAEGKVYYLALVRDASVEMAQKEQTRQLIIAVDHLDRPVIVLDPERHIVQCNRAFTEMFGYCINEASGSFAVRAAQRDADTLGVIFARCRSSKCAKLVSDHSSARWRACGDPAN